MLTFKLRKHSCQKHLMLQLNSVQSFRYCCTALKPVWQLINFKGYEIYFKGQKPIDKITWKSSQRGYELIQKKHRVLFLQGKKGTSASPWWHTHRVATASIPACLPELKVGDHQLWRQAGKAEIPGGQSPSFTSRWAPLRSRATDAQKVFCSVLHPCDISHNLRARLQI